MSRVACLPRSRLWLMLVSALVALSLQLASAEACLAQAPVPARFRASRILRVVGDGSLDVNYEERMVARDRQQGLPAWAIAANRRAYRAEAQSRSNGYEIAGELTCWYVGRTFGERLQAPTLDGATVSRIETAFDGLDTYMIFDNGRSGALMPDGRGRVRASADIRKGADPDMLACGWARWLYFRNNTDVERSLSARPAGASPQQTAATLTAIVGRSLPYARTDTGARYGIRAKCDRRAGNLLVLLQVHRGGLDGPLVREVRASELRIWPGGKPFPARIVERSMDALGRCRMTEEYTVRKAWFGKAAGMASAVPSIESAIQVSDRRLAEPFSYAVSSTWLTRSEAAARYERVLRDRTEAHRRRATRRLVSPVFAMGSIMVIVAGGVILWKRQRGVTKPGA